jgi:hypothetical protein
MNDQGTDGKVVADQLGHTLDVNQNVNFIQGLRSTVRRKRSTTWIHWFG